MTSKIPIGLDLELAVPTPCGECGELANRYAARLDGGSLADVVIDDPTPDTVALCGEHMTLTVASRLILGGAR